MAITSKSVEIKCRRCGKTAKAEDFVLDYVYKMAVCPSCVKERKSNESKTLKQSFKESEAPAKEEAPKRATPPGWDAEDEYLEKLARQKQKQAGDFAESSPKPYQMGGINRTQTSPYTAPKPQAAPLQPMQRASQASQSPSPSKPMSAADFGMRAKPASSQPTQQEKPQSVGSCLKDKIMGIADFGMRSSARQQEPPHTQQAASVPSSKPMGAADFSMRSTNKAEDEVKPKMHSLAEERLEKAGSDPNKTKYKCKKCGYEFFYNQERNMPKACPYCNTQIMHLI